MPGFFVLIHALGAAQGIFLATVLASRGRSSLPNRLLAVVMVAFAVDLGMAVYHAAGVDRIFPHLIGIDFALAFLYGPLLYLYARTLSYSEKVFRPAYWWHFAPFLVLMLAMAPFYLQSGAEKLAFMDGGSEGAWSTFLGIVTHVKLIHAICYIAAILPMLRRHRVRIRETMSSTDRINLVWLRNLLYGIIALATFAVVVYLLSLRDSPPVIGLDPETTYDDYMLLALAVFVYAIGYFGLRQPEVFDARAHESEELEVPAIDPEAAPRYARSGMDSATAEQHEETLRAVMERERLYRRGDLTLQDLSDAAGISPHHVTEVLNTRLGQNFYDFVNAYRVREVQERLVDPANAHLTLLAIGMEAGFNSKSSFNHTFKKLVRMTPSEFRARSAAEGTPAAYQG